MNYRLSPIKNEEKLKEAVIYVAENTKKLSEKIIGKKLPITSLTVFSHFPDEFENLKKILLTMGKLYNENNGPRVELNNPIQVGSNTIKYLRVRKPDSERPQVGCDDFDVENYQEFKEKYLSEHPDNLRLIDRGDYEMIEFFDQDFDVLAYVLSEED